MSTTASALLAPAPGAPFERDTITRRELRAHDVLIEIAYAGICHSDIHNARDEWGPGTYPMVPGHEIAGHVTEVGSEVTDFAVGDRVGVGCFVDSCGQCEGCLAGEEQFCDQGTVMTYNSRDYDGDPTYVGLPENPQTFSVFGLTSQRRSLAGSNIGGIRETQEMLDFSAEHGITSQVEVIDADHVDAAYDRVVNSDVRYRFVIDIATL